MNTRTNAMAQIDMRSCGWTLTGIYLLLGYFTHLGFEAEGLVAYSLAMTMVALVHMAGRTNRQGVSIPSLVLLALLALLFGVSCLFSPYGHSTGLRMMLFLVDAVILVSVLKVQDCDFDANWFYIVATVGLAVTFLTFVVKPTFFMDFGGVFKSIDDLSPLLWGAADKNRTALFVFLYFTYSVKRRKRLGVFLSLIYPLLYFGRQYLIMVAIVIAFLFISRRINRTDFMARLFTAKGIFAFFMASAVVISFFSTFWVGVVMAGGVGEYKSGWNDSSNAVRMSSIRYISNEIVSDPSYIVYGLDSNIFSVLGISQNDTRKGQTYYVNDSYRLVQPHQEVLNTLLKEGLLVTICIYGLVSYLLSLLMNDRYSRSTVLAFLFGSLILHEMFVIQSFLLLLFVLCTKDKTEDSAMENIRETSSHPDKLTSEGAMVR